MLDLFITFCSFNKQNCSKLFFFCPLLVLLGPCYLSLLQNGKFFHRLNHVWIYFFLKRCHWVNIYFAVEQTFLFRIGFLLTKLFGFLDMFELESYNMPFVLLVSSFRFAFSQSFKLKISTIRIFRRIKLHVQFFGITLKPLRSRASTNST